METLSQTIALTPLNTTQNVLSLQIVPNPQNISPLSEHSLPQNNITPLPSEQTPSLNISPPSDVHGTSSARTEHAVPSAKIDANNLTIQQALDLFELLQARKSREADKSVNVDAQPVAGTQRSIVVLNTKNS